MQAHLLSLQEWERIAPYSPHQYPSPSDTPAGTNPAGRKTARGELAADLVLSQLLYLIPLLKLAKLFPGVPIKQNEILLEIAV